MKSLQVESKMCYSPLTQFEFHELKRDKCIKDALNIGNIYLICRRPRLFFKDASVNQETLSVKIFQNHTNKEILFNINLHQENICRGNDELSIEVGLYKTTSITSYFGPSSNQTQQKGSNQLYDGIKVYRKNSKQQNEFLVWFNPEKLIHLYLSGIIQADPEGLYEDLFSLVNYDVLYVGRTNDMHHRQSHHEHVLEILARESSQWGDLPAREICLVSLVVADAYEVVSLGSETKTPINNKEDYYYDLEKALVRALDPFYNRDKFLNYPSQDKQCLLHSKLIYDTLFYNFNIPIVFNCGGKHIRGYNDHIRVSSDGSVTIVDNEGGTQ